MWWGRVVVQNAVGGIHMVGYIITVLVHNTLNDSQNDQEVYKIFSKVSNRSAYLISYKVNNTYDIKKKYSRI